MSSWVSNFPLRACRLRPWIAVSWPGSVIWQFQDREWCCYSSNVTKWGRRLVSWAHSAACLAFWVLSKPSAMPNLSLSWVFLPSSAFQSEESSALGASFELLKQDFPCGTEPSLPPPCPTGWVSLQDARFALSMIWSYFHSPCKPVGGFPSYSIHGVS